MKVKWPTEERVVSEALFDDEFKAHIDWKDELSQEDAMFIMNEYRVELLRLECSQFRSYVSTSTGEEYIPVRIYDDRRLAYVKEKIIKRFGSIEAGLKAESQVNWLMNAFKEGIIKPVNELAEKEKYDIGED